MNAIATVVAALASFGVVVATAACTVVVLIKKSLPHILPIAVIGFAMLAADAAAVLGYWWWAAGDAALVVLGAAILVLVVQLRKLRDQIEKAKEMRRG